jgi:hypothetical protein
MHQEIRHNLENFLQREEFLQGEDVLRIPAEFHAHLGECRECSDELGSLEKQSQLLRSLRGPRDIEPPAGFYARVMERIEAQPPSIWSVFLDRKFGLRLAVASAALVALLGTYLVISEPGGPEFASSPAVVLTDTPRATVASNQVPASTEAAVDQAEVNQPEVNQENGRQQQLQRDAVLVDLASYHQ